MKRNIAVCLALIFVILVVFLPFYYAFSYGKNDGLQQTIEQGNGTEGGGYSAPLNYGSNYLESLASGVVGIAVVFAAFYAILLTVKRRRGKGNE